MIVIRAVGGLAVADIVEDEEFRFRAQVRGVRDARLLQVRFGFAGNIARIAAVRLVRDRIHRVRHDAQRGHLRERVEYGSRRVEYEQHIAGFNGLPAADRRAVKPEAFLETDSSSSEIGAQKCCQVPRKSQNFTSTS